MRKNILAVGLVSVATILSSCSITTATYKPSGNNVTSYNVGDNNPGYYWGDGYYPTYRPRYYDSDFYVKDTVLYGPGYRRGVYRGW